MKIDPRKQKGKYIKVFQNSKTHDLPDCLNNVYYYR